MSLSLGDEGKQRKQLEEVIDAVRMFCARGRDWVNCYIAPLIEDLEIPCITSSDH